MLSSHFSFSISYGVGHLQLIPAPCAKNTKSTRLAAAYCTDVFFCCTFKQGKPEFAKYFQNKGLTNQNQINSKAIENFLQYPNLEEERERILGSR